MKKKTKLFILLCAILFLLVFDLNTHFIPILIQNNGTAVSDLLLEYTGGYKRVAHVSARSSALAFISVSGDSSLTLTFTDAIQSFHTDTFEYIEPGYAGFFILQIDSSGKVIPHNFTVILPRLLP
jgi:hypothetical protein